MASDSVVESLGAELLPACTCFQDEQIRENYARGMVVMAQTAAMQIQISLATADMCPSVAPAMMAMITSTLLTMSAGRPDDEQMGPAPYLARLRESIEETRRVLSLHYDRAERLLRESHVVH